MNMNMMTSLSIFLVLVIFSLRPVSSVSINIEPNSSRISCLADKLDPSAREIISMQLKSPENSLIVSMDANSKITVIKDPRLYITENEGKLDMNMSKSYLTIKMSNILASSQSGMYTCFIYYTDKYNIPNSQIASGRLNITIKDVYTALENLRLKVKSLETELKRLKSKDRQQEKTLENHRQVFKVLKKKVGVLEEASKTLRQNTTDIQEKGQACAFSAYYNSSDEFKEDGAMLLFRDVSFNQCNVYNGSSGVFTAPQAGLYRFSMTITSKFSGDMIKVRLYVNTDDVGQLYAKDYMATGDQTSMTLLLELSKGDEVKPKVIDSNTYTLDSYRKFSVFCGYRIPTL